MTNEELIAEAEYVMDMLGHPRDDGIWGRLITALREAEAENALLRDPDRHTRFVQITLQRDEARQEAEQLKAENMRLREALEVIGSWADEPCSDIARRALGGEP